MPRTTKGQASYTIALNKQPDENVTVTMSNRGGHVTFAPTSLTFTPQDWNTPQTVTVTSAAENTNTLNTEAKHQVAVGTAAAVDGPSISIRLRGKTVLYAVNYHKDMSLSISEGGSRTFSLHLERNIGFPITLRPTHFLGEDIFTFSPKSITFTPDNWNQPQEFTVAVAKDFDGVTEFGHYYMKIDELPGDPWVRSTPRTYLSLDSGQMAMEVHPDDLNSDGVVEITEGQGATAIRVRATLAPDNATTIHYLQENQPEQRRVRPSPKNIHLTPGSGGNWNTWQTINLSAVHAIDTDEDTSVLFRVIHRNTASYWRINVKIIDGTAPGLSIRETTREMGGRDSSNHYHVKLTTDPGGGATVTVTIGTDHSDVTTNPTSLTFTGGSDGNWNAEKKVTISYQEDDDFLDEFLTVSHAVSGYGDVTKGPDISVIIRDSGGKEGISAIPNPLTVATGGMTDQVWVKLVKDPGDGVTVTVTPLIETVDDGLWKYEPTSLTFSPTSLTFTGGASGTWNTRQPITVSRTSSNAALRYRVHMTLKSHTDPVLWAKRLEVIVRSASD